jgi:hypothetical protein
LQVLVRVADGVVGHDRFDIVRVVANDASWGRMESLDQWISEGNSAESWPKKGVFVLVKVLALAPSSFKYLEEEDSFTASIPTHTGSRVGNIVYRARKHILDIDALSLNEEDTLKLTNGGTIEISPSAFNQALFVKAPNPAMKAQVLEAIKLKMPGTV